MPWLESISLYMYCSPLIFMKARHTRKRKLKHQQERSKPKMIPRALAIAIGIQKFDGDMHKREAHGISHRFDGGWSKRNLISH